jgi:hypothetical protein
MKKNVVGHPVLDYMAFANKEEQSFLWVAVVSSSIVGAFLVSITFAERTSPGSLYLEAWFILHISCKARLYRAQTGNQGTPRTRRRRTTSLPGYKRSLPGKQS